MMKEVCHAARERPMRVREWSGEGGLYLRMGEFVDSGKGVAKDRVCEGDIMVVGGEADDESESGENFSDRVCEGYSRFDRRLGRQGDPD